MTEQFVEGEEERRPPTRQSDAWLDAFHLQLTDELLDGVRNFARVRALGVANAGRKVDDYYVRELVLDAVADTYEGVLRWDPSRVSLAAHLVRAVQFRSRNDREHAITFPHDALGDATERSKAAESEASYTVSVASVIEQQHCSEVMAQLREAAASDKDVLRVSTPWMPAQRRRRTSWRTRE